MKISLEPTNNICDCGQEMVRGAEDCFGYVHFFCSCGETVEIHKSFLK